jgi:hypothetical protein
MKVTVARASNRLGEDADHTINMTWAGQFADELLKLNEQIPLTKTEDGEVVGWETPEDEEFSYVVSVNKKTRAVEIMIYDNYIE